uniref:BHLH domain-containing protein n=1 Tax=Panagrellus redivivus TaxID=6233 RepID=A0A7E4W2W7_PANRE
MSDPVDDLEGSSSSASFNNSSNSSDLSSPGETSESPNSSSSSSKNPREAHNVKERRRMGTINQGFRTLSEIIHRYKPKPEHKMSKASILQLTVKHIKNIEAKYEVIRDAAFQLQPKPIGNIVDPEQHIERLKQAIEKEHTLRMLYEKELVQMRKMAAGDTSVTQPQPPVLPDLYATLCQVNPTTSTFFPTGNK